MKEIKKLFDEFCSTSFPENLNGEEIKGIDLNLLDSDTAGLISKFISYRGQLTFNDFNLLHQCRSNLKMISIELKTQERLYFTTLLNIANRTIEYLTNSKRFINTEVDEQKTKNWKKDFAKIRDILNEWDPLGVSDSVEDEYDSINFAAYSVLANNGNVDEIKIAIKKYLNESMGMDISDLELTDLAIKIKNIKE